MEEQTQNLSPEEMQVLQNEDRMFNDARIQAATTYLQQRVGELTLENYRLKKQLEERREEDDNDEEE